ncbi:hypothetical protein [Maricaulis salignorans]|uniref:hypothetical protein n=1 Tax=Maricaulis salignorans TaxID=144026 RepID=UPI003A924789
MYPDWPAVEAAIDHLVAASEKPFSAATALRARALAVISQGRYRAPDEVGDGYGPTISFHWTNLAPHPIEIEAHSDHYELYLFRPGAFDVQHFACQSDGVMPAELIAALDALLIAPQAD